MKYSVCLLFDEKSGDLLLQLKDRTAFAGKYNGVGGKAEPTDQDMEDCARREIYEETGIAHVRDMKWLGNLILPEDCASPDTGKPCQLYFYAGRIDRADIKPMPGATERLEFFDRDLFFLQGPGMPPLAGEGDLLYFVHRAVRAMF